MLQKIKNPKNIRIITLIIVIILFIYSFLGNEGELVEDVSIPMAVGYDIKEMDGKEYVVPILMAVQDQQETGIIQIGEGNSLGESREDRSSKMDKKLILGVERSYIISEAQARLGVRELLDILVRNPRTNDRGYVSVCSGKAYDILKQKNIKGVNPAEYTENLIKNLNEAYFYVKNFTAIDMIVRVDAEGKTLVLPYIEMKDGGLQNTGLAIFKGEKMIGVANLNETKFINLMKFNGGKGMITIQENVKEYINFYGKSKRKVKCFKENGKYNFIINIDLKGTVVSNVLYKNLDNDPKEVEKCQNEIEKEVESQCQDVVEKINKEYKTDVLGLGKYAVAKYGRDTGQDWNDIVPKSNIKVKANVTLESQGRANYTEYVSNRAENLGRTQQQSGVQH